MDVAGAVAHRVGDEHVDQLDDAELGAGGGGLLDAHLLLDLLDVLHLGGEVGHQVGGAAVGGDVPVVPLDGHGDVLEGAQDGRDAQLGLVAEVVEQAQVGGVHHGHDQLVLVLLQGDAMVFAGHALRDQGHHVEIGGGVLLGGRHRHAQLAGQEVGLLELVDEAQGDQGVAQAQVGGLLLEVQGLLQLQGGDDAVLDQDGAQGLALLGEAGVAPDLLVLDAQRGHVGLEDLPSSWGGRGR